jgi:TolB protein
MRLPAVLLVVLVTSLVLAFAGSAATPAPGAAGKIVVTSKSGDVKGEHFDLYLLDSAGGPPMQITKTPSLDELWPTFSPDGTKIVFVRCACDISGREGTVVEGSADLYVMNAVGGPARRLTHLGPAFAALNRPSWSPDGKRVLFDAVYRGDWPHIYEVAADGGKIVRLTSAQHEDIAPVLSPDGKELATFRTPHDGEPYAWKMGLYVIDLATGKATRVAGGVPYYDRARWSPDGSRLAVSRDAGKYLDNVWTVAPDGSAPRQVTRGSGDKQWPAWSPDGSRLAYVKLPRASDNYGYAGTVTTVRPDGTAAVTLPAPLALNEQPDWQPGP